MKISSVSSNKKQIIIKPKKPLRQNRFWQQILVEAKTSEGWIGLATIKKGSKTFKISCGIWDLNRVPLPANLHRKESFGVLTLGV